MLVVADKFEEPIRKNCAGLKKTVCVFWEEMFQYVEVRCR